MKVKDFLMIFGGINHIKVFDRHNFKTKRYNNIENAINDYGCNSVESWTIVNDVLEIIIHTMKDSNEEEPLKVWCVNGHDDDGDWEVELFSTYEKARKAFESYIDDFNFNYGDYDEDKEEYESVCEVDGDYASYDCGSHYGSFWISEVGVR